MEVEGRSSGRIVVNHNSLFIECSVPTLVYNSGGLGTKAYAELQFKIEVKSRPLEPLINV